MRKTLAIAAAFAALSLGALALPPVPLDPSWRDVPVTAEAHQLRGDAEAHEALRVGALIYRGGVHLTSEDEGFGGFSGLLVSKDGERLIAVSDRGQWLKAKLDYDEAGRLAGLNSARMAAITDKDGVVLAGSPADAEGLAFRDKRFIVSFEREARIDAYRWSADKLLVLDETLATFEPPETPPYNQGLESVEALEGGLLVLSEEPFPSGANGYFLADDGRRLPARYKPAKDFSVTEIAAGQTSLYILERAYSPLMGVRARLARAYIPTTDVLSIEGEELARFNALYAVDNMEGLDVRTGEDGRDFLYLISDDNHSARQKTILLMFEVAPEEH